MYSDAKISKVSDARRIKRKQENVRGKNQKEKWECKGVRSKIIVMLKQWPTLYVKEHCAVIEENVPCRTSAACTRES